MSRCPITYETIEEGRYSPKGLRRLSPRLKNLKDFPYTAQEQIREAQIRSSKMSIQGRTAQAQCSAHCCQEGL